MSTGGMIVLLHRAPAIGGDLGARRRHVRRIDILPLVVEQIPKINCGSFSRAAYIHASCKSQKKSISMNATCAMLVCVEKIIYSVMKRFKEKKKKKIK
jgi:hypothetical protein